MVRRGCLLSSVDAEDGRRIALELTRRGQAAVDAVVRAVDAVDAELAEAVSAAELRALRKALAALGEIKTERALRGASTLVRFGSPRRDWNLLGRWAAPVPWTP